MDVFIIIVILIELLFFILGAIYLYKKTINRKVLNYTLFIIYFLVLVLFNIIVLKIMIFNKCENSNVNRKVTMLKTNNKKLDNDVVDLKEKYEELYNTIDNTKYVELKQTIDELMKNTSDLTEILEKLEKEKEILNENLEGIKKEYEKLEEKTKYMIKNFPTYHQFPNYPNGCESVALYLMLKFHNVNVTVEEIVEKLKKGDAPYKSNGVLYGGDPEVEFVGDPRLKSGYGVYEKPIINVANQFKSEIKNITGSSLDEVLSIVKKGMPVQVWASINLRNTYICAKWQSTSTDRIVEWKCGLHSLVIIGYTYNKIITSDPYTGSTEYYSKTQFEKMYNTYGKRAIYYEV